MLIMMMTLIIYNLLDVIRSVLKRLVLIALRCDANPTKQLVTRSPTKDIDRHLFNKN